MRQAGHARGKTWAMAMSLAAHLAIGLTIASVRSEGPPVATVPEPIEVTLVEPLRPPVPTPEPAVEDPGASQATAPLATLQPAPTPPRPVTRIVRAPANLETVAVSATPAVIATATVGEAQLVGARTAGGTGPGIGGAGTGSGQGGGDCDMVRRLQDALREDTEVRAAVMQAHRAADVGGRAMLVWDGDWVQTPGQAGKGLAGVRQAIALEVAFAPSACRAETMRGLVVISMGDGARVALGAGRWRWSDLLSARRGG